MVSLLYTSIAAIFAPRSLRAREGVRHHVDLCVHGVRAPDHDEIGHPHLARVDAADLAGAGGEADPGRWSSK